MKIIDRFISLFDDSLIFNVMCTLKDRQLRDSFIEKNDYLINFSSLSNSQFLSDYIIRKYSKKLNWELLSYYQVLSEDIIREYKNLVNWTNIFSWQKLSEEFLYEFEDRLSASNLDLILKNKRIVLSEDFYESYLSVIDMDVLMGYRHLSMNFINKHIDKIHFAYIYNHVLSEDFIEQYQDRVNWSDISQFQKLSESFIEKHQDKVNWSYISQFQILSETFIEKYSHKLSLYFVIRSQKLSEEFIRRHIKDFNLNDICEFQDVSEKFLSTYIGNTCISKALKRKQVSESFLEKLIKHKKYAEVIVKSQILSENFLKKYHTKFNKFQVIQYQNIPQELILEYIKFDSFRVCCCQKLSEETMSECMYYLDWDAVSTCQELSEFFIDKFKDKLNLFSVFSNNNVSYEFLESYNDKYYYDIYMYHHCHKTYHEKINEMRIFATINNLEFDGEFLYAYIQSDEFGRDLYNSRILYQSGKYYKTHFSVTIKSDHCHHGFTIFQYGDKKVKVSVKDWGTILNHSDEEAKVYGFEVL